MKFSHFARVLLALTILTLLAAQAQARLFRQTFGATVPTADGGCVWNQNQDFFVPRYCDSARYGLFSACKHGHTTSPACRFAHPIYKSACGKAYCTTYGACRYRWRDHVYKSHCGCTPLACYHGPWRNSYADCCMPPCHRWHARKHGSCKDGSCTGGFCCLGSLGGCTKGLAHQAAPDFIAETHCSVPAHKSRHYLPNVEPIELASLGSIGTGSVLEGDQLAPPRPQPRQENLQLPVPVVPRGTTGQSLVPSFSEWRQQQQQQLDKISKDNPNTF
ncbi:MAG: hypothetical protein RH917_08020 [Lacipirellulaceae bacterium]